MQCGDEVDDVHLMCMHYGPLCGRCTSTIWSFHIDTFVRSAYSKAFPSSMSLSEAEY